MTCEVLSNGEISLTKGVYFLLDVRDAEDITLMVPILGLKPYFMCGVHPEDIIDDFSVNGIS